MSKAHHFLPLRTTSVGALGACPGWVSRVEKRRQALPVTRPAKDAGAERRSNFRLTCTGVIVFVGTSINDREC